MPANTPPPVPASPPGYPDDFSPITGLPSTPTIGIIGSGSLRPWRSIKRNKACKHCGRDHRTPTYSCVKCGLTVCSASVGRSDDQGLVHLDAHCYGKVIRVVPNPVSKIVIVGG